MLEVELVYIAQNQVTVCLLLTLPEGSSVADAIEHAHIYETHPETRELNVGIYSHRVALDSLLRNGDRIEFYRELLVDPKEKRRQLARKNTK